MEQYFAVCALLFVTLTLYTPHIDTFALQDQTWPSLRPNKLVSYSIPDQRPLKQALGFIEDTYLNFTELTAKYNYPTEVHSVITEDGYILDVFRILSKCAEGTKSYPVLLMHGVFDSADLWITRTNIGLGYVLADNCYDVWAANNRGNTYSRRHISLDPNKDPEFWEFTFDESGNYDFPALIDYILHKTGYPKLFFVGHSQGTTEFFTMGSLRPDYNSKVMLAVALGPVAWMKNLMHPLIVFAAKNYEIIKTILEAAGYRELFPRNRIVHHILEFLCQKAPKVCDLGLTISTGQRQGTIPLQTISIAFGHLLSGTSVKNLSHFAQLVNSGNFQRFNEGTKGNLRRYGSVKPPLYNVSLVSSPVLLVSAQSDLLSTLKDVKRLASNLPNLVENYIVPRPYWSHHNHVYDEKVLELIYPKILAYFDKFKNFR